MKAYFLDFSQVWADMMIRDAICLPFLEIIWLWYVLHLLRASTSQCSSRQVLLFPTCSFLPRAPTCPLLLVAPCPYLLRAPNCPLLLIAMCFLATCFNSPHAPICQVLPLATLSYLQHAPTCPLLLIATWSYLPHAPSLPLLLIATCSLATCFNSPRAPIC